MFDHCPLECGVRLSRVEEEEDEEEDEIEEGDHIFVTKLHGEEEWIATMHTHS